jgi:hypothetical protein
MRIDRTSDGQVSSLGLVLVRRVFRALPFSP